MRTIFDFDPIYPNKDFRVGFIGSQSVGKTRQLTKLAQILRVPTITEGVRHVVTSMGYNSVLDVPDTALMQWKVLQQQIHQENESPRWLSDRTTLDNAAYFYRYCVNRGKVSPAEAEAYFKLARENAQRYTHLIYFPIMWEGAQADGFRDTDPVERIEIDKIVRQLIQDFGVSDRVYTITMDDEIHGRDARLIEIMSHLNLWQAMRETGLLGKQKEALV